jgi:hypothetical protein
MEDDRPPWEIDDIGEGAPEEFGREQMGQFMRSPPAGDAYKTPPLSAWERLQQGVTRGGSSVLSGIPEFLKGAAKEAPLVAMRAAQLPAEVASGAASLVADRMSPETMAADIKRVQQREAFKRRLEEPFSASSDATLGERLGRGTTRAAPQVALAALTGGASLPTQSALAALSQGAQSLSEGATPGEASSEASFAGIAPGAARVVPAVGNYLKKAAVDQYLKALNPTRVGTKATATKIVPELLERGVTGDLESLAGQATKQSSAAGKGLEQVYGQSGAGIDAIQIAKELEKLKAPFIVQSSTGSPVVANPGAVTAIENIQDALGQLGDTVAPDQLWKFRQNIDDIVNASNGFQRELPRGKASSIAKQARAAIQKELTAAVPNVARLNAEYTLWQGLEDVAKATLQRKVGQQGASGMLARTAGGAIGAGIGFGGGPTGAGVGALVGQEVSKRLVDLMSSPTWRTVSAVQKHEIARLLTSGKPEAAVNYLIRLAASVSSGGPQNRR